MAMHRDPDNEHAQQYLQEVRRAAEREVQKNLSAYVPPKREPESDLAWRYETWMR